MPNLHDAFTRGTKMSDAQAYDPSARRGMANEIGGVPLDRLKTNQEANYTRTDPYMLVITDLVNLHAKKKSDYASSNNEFSNFEFAARYAGITVNQQFDCLIGTKIARLLNLKESGKIAKNESIEDSEIDLANYIIIKKSYNIKKNGDGDIPL